MLKSVPGKLVKEKGQNLKSFLKTFQSSTVARPPRPDFSKVTQVHPDTENRKLSLIRRHVSILIHLCAEKHYHSPTDEGSNSQLSKCLQF